MQFVVMSFDMFIGLSPPKWSVKPTALGHRSRGGGLADLPRTTETPGLLRDLFGTCLNSASQPASKLFNQGVFIVMSKALVMKSVAAAALFIVSGASFAGPTLYTSAASFAAATSAPGVDTYTGFSITGTTSSPINRTAGAYSYTAAASTSTFFGAGTTANPWLSTNLATDSVTFSGFSSGVNAVGGNFFGSDINGLFLQGNISLTATDSTGSTTFLLTNAQTTSFLGFVSAGSISSLVVSAVQGTSPLWPTIDNLTLAKAATVVAVPEPETYALMIAGLGVLGFVARRRKSA